MKKPIYKKWWFWLIIILIIGGIGSAGAAGNKTKIDNSNATESKNTSSAKEETSNTSPTQDETEAPKEEVKEEVVKVGGNFESDGLKITVLSADTDYQVPNDEYGFWTPGEGKKYIMVDFTAENIGSSDKYVGMTDFKCYADNSACDEKYLTGDAEFIGTTLSAGRNVSFSLSYEVPKDAKIIELEYEANMFTDEKIKIEIQGE